MSLFKKIGKQAANHFIKKSELSDQLKDSLIGGGLGGIAGGIYGLINPGTYETIDATGKKIVNKNNRFIAAAKKGLMGAGIGAAGGYLSNVLKTKLNRPNPVAAVTPKPADTTSPARTVTTSGFEDLEQIAEGVKQLAKHHDAFEYGLASPTVLDAATQARKLTEGIQGIKPGALPEDFTSKPVPPYAFMLPQEKEISDRVATLQEIIEIQKKIKDLQQQQ
jgi:hypothetical protein